MAEKCASAYRKNGDASVHCHQINGKFDYCGVQYFCTNSGRWEAPKDIGKCPLKSTKEKKQNENL